MIFLAVDTSLQATSVAIMEITLTKVTKILAEQYLNVELTHSETTQFILEKCLSDARLELKDIDYFVAVTGPGSFTGLRIGVTLVKTLAATQKKECIAVNSLSALAYDVERHFHDDAKTLVVPMIDARNERVFAEVINKHKIVYPPQGIAFEDLLKLLQQKYKSKECSLLMVTVSHLPYMYKYADALANFKEFNMIETEVTATKALYLVAEMYKEHVCTFVHYNDLQPNYYALSQAERSKLKQPYRAQVAPTK